MQLLSLVALAHKTSTNVLLHNTLGVRTPKLLQCALDALMADVVGSRQSHLQERGRRQNGDALVVEDQSGDDGPRSLQLAGRNLLRQSHQGWFGQFCRSELSKEVEGGRRDAVDRRVRVVA